MGRVILRRARSREAAASKLAPQIGTPTLQTPCGSIPQPQSEDSHILRRHRCDLALGRAYVEAKWTWEGPFLELEAAFLAAC